MCFINVILNLMNFLVCLLLYILWILICLLVIWCFIVWWWYDIRKRRKYEWNDNKRRVGY